MIETNIHTRPGLPPEMQLLLADYPREAWSDHPSFAQSTQNWLGAHQMFRQLGAVVRELSESYLSKERDPEDFANRLSYYGNALVANLHGHHTWEDRSFFPELRTADQRFEHGLEMLEADHTVLDATIDTLTTVSNRTLKLLQLDENQARDEAGKLQKSAQDIQKFLARHLADEEDLIVPIILHHRLRG